MVTVEQRVSGVALLAAALAVAGGALAIVSSVLEWGHVSSSLGFPARLSVTVKAGGLMVALGILLAVAGVVMLFAAARGWRVVLGIAAMLVGLFVAAIGTYFAVSETPYVRTTADFVADVRNGDADRIERVLDAFVDRGVLKVSRDVAVYLTLAGGVVGWAGGLVELLSARRLAVRGAPPPAPEPVAGWGPVPPGGPGAQEPPPPPEGPGAATPPSAPFDT
jgi:hypothetical protein